MSNELFKMVSLRASDDDLSIDPSKEDGISISSRLKSIRLTHPPSEETRKQIREAATAVTPLKQDDLAETTPWVQLKLVIDAQPTIDIRSLQLIIDGTKVLVSNYVSTRTSLQLTTRYTTRG